MGAGAGKEAPTGDGHSCSKSSLVALPNSSPQKEDSSAAQIMASCENCSTNFSLLKRKKPCSDCLKNHCSNCLVKESLGKVTKRRCAKCCFLISGNFTRVELMDYPTKDLRHFLVQKRIPLNNCTEKTDLVELLLKVSNNTHYQQEQAQHQRHLLELQERKRQREAESLRWGSTNSPPATNPEGDMPSPPPYSTTQRTSSTPEPPTSGDPPRSRTHSTASDANSDASDEASDQATDNPPGPGISETTEDPTVPAPSINVTVTPESTSEQNSPQIPTRRLAHLNDVENIEGIEDLTIRQLKEILATNYVDYKGCCEKFELIERVQRLWHETSKNKEKVDEIESKTKVQGSGGISSAEHELCKICMDAVIDCVLLDCGHMVACTQCGKRLAECPVCRQYVVRVVHVFKA